MTWYELHQHQLDIYEYLNITRDDVLMNKKGIVTLRQAENIIDIVNRIPKQGGGFDSPYHIKQFRHTYTYGTLETSDGLIIVHSGSFSHMLYTHSTEHAPFSDQYLYQIYEVLDCLIAIDVKYHINEVPDHMKSYLK